MSESKFVYVTYIRTTPDKLWKALTEPEFTMKWWCETRQRSDWRKGSSWQLTAPGDRVADSGEVLEIDPPNRLVVSWRNELFADIRAEGYSRYAFEIEQAGGCVKLTVTHEMAKPGSKLIEKVAGGWPVLLASLKSLLETGDALELTRRWPKDV